MKPKVSEYALELRALLRVEDGVLMVVSPLVGALIPLDDPPKKRPKRPASKRRRARS